MKFTEPVQESVAELALRLRQQGLVAGFGRFSLRHDELQLILDEASAVAADGLSTRFAKILQYLPESHTFLVRAGTGWHEGVVGHTLLGDDLDSPAGYAFKTGEAVLSNHLGSETRFRTPALLVEHGVHSAINVLIGDQKGAHFGVLEVDSTSRDEFNRHDIAFLESLANTIADAIGKEARIDAVRRSEELAHILLQASPDCVTILSADGVVEAINSRGLDLLEMDEGNPPIGLPWESLWPAEHVDRLREALAIARSGGPTRFQGFCPTARGTARWWDVLVAPVSGIAGERRLVAISRDITDTMAEAEAKDRLLKDKDLLMQEVHHRVKNSLQMVQNLLSLQARAADDEATAEVLRESAARVHTIGAIHDRLYREGSGLDVAIGPYLQELIDDLRDGMASTQAGRSVILDADSATWPAAAVPALGLVTTELVTNALKYGEGVIRVTFRQPAAAQGTLTVDDEGTNLPPDFDPGTSRGLGMRIVTGLLRPRGGSLKVLRDRPTTCLHATFPRDA